MSVRTPLVSPQELSALHGKHVLITGGDGMLGRAFAESLAPLAGRVHVRALSREALDTTDAERVMREAAQPLDIIIHCAAISIADDCEKEPERARRVHVDGTRNVCRLAHETGARIFYPQSFLIFDGSVQPVLETTPPAVSSVYGQVKIEAEAMILDEVPGSIAGRLAGFFGGDEKDKNFVGKIVRHIHQLIGTGVSRLDVGDRVWQPTYTMDIAGNVLLLLAEGREGIYNVSSHGEASFFDVAQVCVRELGLAPAFTVERVASEVFDRTEAVRRPKRVVMRNDRLMRESLERQRTWQEALVEYLERPYFDQFRRAPSRAAAHSHR